MSNKNGIQKSYCLVKMRTIVEKISSVEALWVSSAVSPHWRSFLVHSCRKMTFYFQRMTFSSMVKIDPSSYSPDSNLVEWPIDSTKVYSTAWLLIEWIHLACSLFLRPKYSFFLPTSVSWKFLSMVGHSLKLTQLFQITLPTNRSSGRYYFKYSQ